MRKNVGAFAVAVVITLVLGASTGDEADASQGATKLAYPTTGPAVTGPTETGPTETGPTETASPPARASAAPDVVKAGMCSDGARMRLELADTGDRLKVRFEVHQSPPGHEWSIHFRYRSHNIFPVWGHVFFRGTRAASDSGDLVVQVARPVWGPVHPDGVEGGAVDTQTGEVCKRFAWYR
jgi:hypothetical protein